MREQFIVAARHWLGTPFLHQGRNEHGVDCIGLIVVALRQIGVQPADAQGYGRVPSGRFLEISLNQYLRRIAVRQLTPGDVMLFRFKSEPQHVGIRTDRGILHAYAPARKVVETALTASFASRMVAAYQLPMLD